MADVDISEAEHASRGGSWTPGREAILRDMWLRGARASEIAGTLGGVSRNAVIGKAHRLGLQGRSTERLPNDPDLTTFLEEVDDPILDVYSASVALRDLLSWRWEDGSPYLDADVQAHLEDAARLARTIVDGVALVSAADIAAAFRLSGSRKARSPSLRRYLHLLETMPGAGDVPSAGKPSNGSAVLRWDAVYVIAAAARTRSRLRQEIRPIEMPHLVAAMLASPPGQIGAERAGLANAGLEPFRIFAAAVFDDYASHLPKGVTRDLAEMIAREVRDQRRFEGPTLPRTRYASDRVDDGDDAMGVIRDARALADLILLEAASPPLAIGVFGAWGSGKSTLLAMLRREIAAQVEQERLLITASEAVEDPALRRVAGVMQIECNAWSFADSENLWASLTSDIFDQIAAGGSDGRQRRTGARMVADVAERTSAEAALLRAAHSSLQESEARMRSADEALASARIDERAGPIQAMFDVAVELLGGDTKDGRKGKDADTTDVPDAEDGKGGRSGAGSDVPDASADASSPRGAAERPASDVATERTFVTIFRKAVLADGEEDTQERIRSYAKAGGDVTRTVFMVSDFVRAQWRKSLAWVLLAAGLGTACYVSLPMTMASTAPFLRATMATMAGLTAFLGIVTIYVLPAIRVAGLLGTKVRERKAKAQERNAKAYGDRRAASEQLDAAVIAKERSRGFVEKYADIREIGSAPGLMLDYLLEESAEISRLRGSLGTLGAARKAFEKLNAIVQENAGDRSSPIQRIVIYIDDLDRCSERQVVQILEAIHLLMAFPCFVVVAAVDARWLDTSLRATHRQLASDPGGTGPADYLEKIFQIPFWVRRLSTDEESADGGPYGRLIDRLAGNWDETDHSAEDRIDEAVENEHASEKAERFTALAPGAPDLMAPPERQLQRLSRREVDFFHQIGGLAARSPRAVKRMINVYRLIRLVSTTKEDSTFIIGPELDWVPAPLVQFALACEVGLTPSSMDVVVGLIEALTDDQLVGWQTILEAEGSSSSPDLFIADGLGLTVQAALEDAFRKALDACPSRVRTNDLRTAFRISGRYSFRAPRSD